LKSQFFWIEVVEEPVVIPSATKSNKKQSKAKSPAVDDDEFDQAVPVTPVSKKAGASAAASANKNSNQKNASNKKASQPKGIVREIC